MKRLLCLLLALLTVAPAASADSLKTVLGVPDRLTLPVFATSTGKTAFLIDAIVEMPDVDSVTTWELLPRAFTEEEALRIVHALGYENVPEVTYQLVNAYPGGNAWLTWDINASGYADPNKYPEDWRADTLSFSRHDWHDMAYCGDFQYINWEQWKVQYIPSATCPLPEESRMRYSLGEARAMAVQLAAQIAPELTLYLECGARGDQTTTDDPEDYDPTMAVPVAYAFYFTREMDGIPVTPVNLSRAGQAVDPYAPSVNEEALCVIVTDVGVWRAQMGSPHTVTRALEEGLTDLVPFRTILEIAQAILPLKYLGQEGQRDDQVVVDRVTFGYMRVRVPYDEERFMLVPVWDFFGNSMGLFSHYNPATGQYEQRWELNNSVNTPVLTINALNGLVIDRTLGY